MDIESRCASVDTCILLRIIVNDIPEQHKKAVDLLLSGQSFYVDQAVISEAVYVQQKLDYSREEITEGLQTLLHNDVFVYDREFYDSIFEEYLSHPSLSFEDCIIAARANIHGHTPLWTFDRKLAGQSPIARLLD